MSDYVYLTGTEVVERAAYTMRSAANDISQAAINISSAVDRLERLLSSTEEAVRELTAAIEAGKV